VFGVTDEDQFMAAVLEGQPEAPRYFGQMKRVNKEGAQAVASLPDVEERPVEQFPRELEAGLLVVDTRPAEEYAGRHVPGTLNIPLGGAFLTWAGVFLPYDRPFALIAGPESVQEAVQQLRLIGLDTLAGYWTPAALDAWTTGGRRLAQIERIEPRRLAQRIARGEVVVVDVRRPEEHAAGHIAGSVNIPLTQLQRRLDEVPGDRPVLVHCQGGTRSPIAASVLSARRPDAVIDLVGGLASWQAAGNPVEHGGQTTMPEAA
jgi:hydroxyacylglutathione hydrolase